MTKDDSQKNSWSKVGGFLYVGCILLGIGAGMLFGNVGAGTMFGVGFFALAAVYLYAAKKK